MTPHFNPRSAKWTAAPASFGIRRLPLLLMVAITAAYLAGELAFQAHLLDRAGQLLGRPEADSLAAWGRLLTGCALSLALWGSFLLPMVVHRSRPLLIVLPLFMFTALAGTYLVLAAEQWLIERTVERATPEQRLTALQLVADAQRRPDAADPGQRTIRLLLPAMLLDDPPSPRAAGAAPGEAAGAAALRSVLMPPILLGFSMLGLVVHLFLTAGYLAALAAPGARHRTALIGATVGSVLLLPLFLPEPAVRTPAFEQLMRATAERMNVAVAHLAGWAVRSEAWLYPIGTDLRRSLDARFQGEPDACAVIAGLAGLGRRC